VYRVIVRARSDANAVEATVRAFYPGWEIEVATLHGVRDREGFLRELREAVRPDRFNLVLLGRSEAGLMELEELFGANVAFKLVPKSKVRNARMHEIARAIESCRALPRNTVSWDGAYVFMRGENTFLRDEDPATDLFLGLRGFRETLSELLGDPIPETPLVARKRGGLHVVYGGSKPIARLLIPDVGEVEAEGLSEHGEHTSINRVVEANVGVLRTFEELSLRLLERFSDRDAVIPWSGGKDSTCTLTLASRVFGDRLRAVFVDTGLEFEQTLKYIEDISRKLGVEVKVAQAGLREEVEKRGLPTLEDRWCTRVKLKALSEAVKRLVDRDTVIVVGDRDSESPLRARRPPVRVDHLTGLTQVAPIKPWSTALTQLYLAWRGVPMNPLYELGFYRIGCRVCPALRSWERLVAGRYGVRLEV